MADQQKQYRAVVGIVQFDPQEREANGKPVRTIVVRNVGIKEQAMRVNATIWPSHAHVEISKDDVVLMEGPFTVNKKRGDGGETRTYYNLSVSRLLVLGRADAGKSVERVNTDEDDEVEDDEDIPF